MDLGADVHPIDAGLDAGLDGGAFDVGSSEDQGLDAGEVSLDASPDLGAADLGRDLGVPSAAPKVILMIGDGMGPVHLEAASLYAHGRAGALFMERMPARGELLTASLSGLTDSAAAATSMSAGIKTYNGRVAIDGAGAEVETMVEFAHRLGLRAGIVSSAMLAHATPAAFSAHHPDRQAYIPIADDQALNVQPDVLFGGGARKVLPQGPQSDRDDQGLLDALSNAGYRIVQNRVELEATLTSPGGRLFGVFAPEHMDYVLDRDASTTQPSLAQMSLAALEHLETSTTGFFLMIEGARIDMASHGNDLERTVTETLDFDQAIEAVAGWAQTQENVTILVTADHECGGLRIEAPRPKGQFPEVTWQWGQHTNARVPIFGQGPGSAFIDGQLLDNTWINAIVRAHLSETALVPPAPGVVIDGHLSDLRFLATNQLNTSGFGAGYNQLEELKVDADPAGLAVGVEGLFQWEENAIVLLIDVDFGAGTGPASLLNALDDNDGRVDGILSSMNLEAPLTPGFGADLAAVSWGGTTARAEDLLTDAGLRGLRPPYGAPNNLAWYAITTNFGEAVRVREPESLTPGEGWELRVPWDRLFPNGQVPPGALIGLSAVLVNDDGGFTSNQALPPFAQGTDNPGRTPIALPGIVVFDPDANDDGRPGDPTPPVMLP